ncbi:MAG TPA: ABC transporter permease [Humisphaera sp.]|jgi:rhamnose transport system permease protein|nr:ABC transporter permease [Humisphaera sp.]
MTSLTASHNIDRAAPHSALRRYLREISVAGAYALLLLVLALRAPRFFHTGEFSDVAISNAPILVATVGMTLVILCRQIDISIGSQLSICCIVAGLLSRAGWPIALVGFGTALCGLLMGAINGALVAYLEIPSIVATLATLVIWREAKRWWSQGAMIKDLRPDFQWFGLGQVGGQKALIVVASIVFVVFAIALRYLAAGRAVYAVGSDREAARLAGIRPRRVTFAVFALMGLLTAVAALLTAVRLPHIDPKTGEDGLELQVIAAVVVGGVAISGGRGTLLGSLVGVALLGTLGPALVFLGMEAYWDKAIRGAIILLAVASDVFYRRAE